MTGLMHSKVELFASEQFGSVTKLRSNENVACNFHIDTTTVTLRSNGTDTSYGISLRRISTPSSSNQPSICTTTLIDSIAPNSSAFNSGRIQAGDRLLAVNCQSTSALTIDEIYEIFESNGGVADLMIEFDVYDTCTPLNEIVSVRLIKRTSTLGIEFQPGNGKKEDPIEVRSLLAGSVAHRCGAIAVGDEFLMIDEIPMSGCTVQEAIRLLQTSHDFVKIHVQKRRRMVERRHTEPQESSIFRFSVDLRPNGQPIGIVLNDGLKVVGVQQHGLTWRTGAVAVDDQVLAINGESIENRPLTEVQRLLDKPTELLNLTLARRLAANEDRQRTPMQSDGPVERKLTVPLTNRLNLIDIQKVIGEMAAAYQNQELQALRAFEKVEDHLLTGKKSLQRSSVDIPTSIRIGQRLSSDSFSSSSGFFGSVSAISQQSVPDTPSCSCANSGNSVLTTSICSPISIFDPNTKNVLLLRDTESEGFGFSISETDDGTVFVSGVKPGGMAEMNGICKGDRIIQVNNVNASGTPCAQLLPLFNTEILELVLFNDDSTNKYGV